MSRINKNIVVKILMSACLMSSSVAWADSAQTMPNMEDRAQMLYRDFVEPGFGSIKNANNVLPHLSDREYVKSPLDFALHTLAHIERVALLAEHICQNWQDLCKELGPKFVGNLIRKSHDYYEKLNLNPNFLAKVGWDESTHPLRYLVAHFGLHLEEHERGPIDNMDRVAKMIRVDIFRKFQWRYKLIEQNGELTELGETFVRVERIADWMDSQLAEERRAELVGDSRQMGNLVERFKNPDELWVAQQIEAQYLNLTAHARLKVFRPKFLSYLYKMEKPNAFSCANVLAPLAEMNKLKIHNIFIPALGHL